MKNISGLHYFARWEGRELPLGPGFCKRVSSKPLQSGCLREIEGASCDGLLESLRIDWPRQQINPDSPPTLGLPTKTRCFGGDPVRCRASHAWLAKSREGVHSDGPQRRGMSVTQRLGYAQGLEIVERQRGSINLLDKRER